MDKVDEIILERITRDFVSGEELSEILGISRTAIWKRVRKLEEYGYEIERTKKGYRLKKRTERLLPFELKPYIKSSWLGRHIRYFYQIDSTNKNAKENEYPDGTVIIAETQTSGRGRKGRKWLSLPFKGLYFSVVIKREILPSLLPVFSLMFPLSVRDTLDRLFNLNVQIKWPNDIYLNGKKLAGFLIETELEGNTPRKIIAGIGINVNHSPEELNSLNGISLKIEIGEEINRKKLLGEIITDLEKAIQKFNPEIVINRLNRYLMWKGEEVVIPEENVEGLLIGVSGSGGIVIKTKNGEKTVFTGDLSLRKKQEEYHEGI